MRECAKRNLRLVLVCLGVVTPGMSASATETELFDKSEVVFESGRWTAVCAWDSTSPETSCSVTYMGAEAEGRPILSVSDGTSFLFRSNELTAGIIRFSVDSSEPIDLSCMGSCQPDGDVGKKMHQALLAGTSLKVASPNLPDLYRPVTIDITPYRAAFAAIEQWHRPN